MFVGAFLRRSIGLRSLLRGGEQAAVPGLAGIQKDLEVEQTIGISGFGPTMRGSYYHRTNEVAIAIARPQLLPRLRPRRGDMPAAHDVVRFYFEYVGEVATQRHLKLKVHPLHAIVGKVEI